MSVVSKMLRSSGICCWK